MTRSDTIEDAAGEIADTVASAGRRTGAHARRAGAVAGSAIDDAANANAARVRRAGRDGSEAYESVADEFGSRAGSFEATIRRNPLATVGGALLVGVVLGRFLL